MEKAHPLLGVFLADDSAIVRERLRTLLSIVPHLIICGEADNATDAISGIESSQADVVILDLNLRNSHGMEVLAAIKKKPTPPVVIILSIHSSPDLTRHYLNSGADYYFGKGQTFDPILKLLEELSQQQPRKVS